MQQSRIHSIERALDNQRRISNAISAPTNSNPRDVLASRRSSPYNRHSPFIANSRHSGEGNSSTPNSLRRTNSSDLTSRSIESIIRRNMRASNSNNSQTLRLCPVRNNSTNQRTNILDSLMYLEGNPSNVRERNSGTFLATNNDSSLSMFSPNTRREAVANFLSQLEMNSNTSNNNNINNIRSNSDSVR